MRIPEHIALDEQAGKADCSKCKTGITAPPSFGYIARVDMLAVFVIQHATHSMRGVASGLTASGKATKAAREALA